MLRVCGDRPTPGDGDPRFDERRRAIGSARRRDDDDARCRREPGEVNTEVRIRVCAAIRRFTADGRRALERSPSGDRTHGMSARGYRLDGERNATLESRLSRDDERVALSIRARRIVLRADGDADGVMERCPSDPVGMRDAHANCLGQVVRVRGLVDRLPDNRAHRSDVAHGDRRRQPSFRLPGDRIGENLERPRKHARPLDRVVVIATLHDRGAADEPARMNEYGGGRTRPPGSPRRASADRPWHRAGRGTLLCARRYGSPSSSRRSPSRRAFPRPGRCARATRGRRSDGMPPRSPEPLPSRPFPTIRRADRVPSPGRMPGHRRVRRRATRYRPCGRISRTSCGQDGCGAGIRAVARACRASVQLSGYSPVASAFDWNARNWRRAQSRYFRSPVFFQRNAHATPNTPA